MRPCHDCGMATDGGKWCQRCLDFYYPVDNKSPILGCASCGLGQAQGLCQTCREVHFGDLAETPKMVGLSAQVPQDPKVHTTYDEVVEKLSKIDGWRKTSDHDKDILAHFAEELKLRDEIIKNPPKENLLWKQPPGLPEESVWVVYQVFYEWLRAGTGYEEFAPVEEVVAFCPSLEVACNLAELLERQEQELQERLERSMNKDGYYSGHACKGLECCTNFFVGLYQP